MDRVHKRNIREYGLNVFEKKVLNKSFEFWNNKLSR